MVNKNFKVNWNKEFDKWVDHSCKFDKNYSKNRNPKPPNKGKVIQMFRKSWEDVDSNLIRKSFIFSGIMTDMNKPFEDSHFDLT